VVLLIVGVALDVTYQRDDRHTLTVGDTVEVDRYVLGFEGLTSEITQTRMSLSATARGEHARAARTRARS
jgi:cytochrome c biogenesis factor